MKPDSIFKTIAALAAFSLIGIVFLMGLKLFVEAWPAFHHFGLGFFIGTDWDPVAEHFGALPFLFGTVVSSLVALVIAIPLSLGVAIFLCELAPRTVAMPIGFLVELLAAIPSVIYGLWGIFYLVPWLRESVEPFLILHFGFLPLFQGAPYGVGILAAGMILAIMIIPIIASLTRDILTAVPQTQREAAFALGATRWETVKIAVLRYGASGIMGAIFLGLGRALGETMAVTMVIGNRPDISASLLAPAYTMSSVLANEFAEATSDMHLSALTAIGFTLFLLTLVVNGGARLLIARMTRSGGGARE